MWYRYGVVKWEFNEDKTKYTEHQDYEYFWSDNPVWKITTTNVVVEEHEAELIYSPPIEWLQEKLRKNEGLIKDLSIYDDIIVEYINKHYMGVSNEGREFD